MPVAKMALGDGSADDVLRRASLRAQRAALMENCGGRDSESDAGNTGKRTDHIKGWDRDTPLMSLDLSMWLSVMGLSYLMESYGHSS